MIYFIQSKRTVADFLLHQSHRVGKNSSSNSNLLYLDLLDGRSIHTILSRLNGLGPDDLGGLG
jgi:hypothetical protein